EGEVLGGGEARGGAPGDDQVAQLVSVLLRIGLAGAHLLSLLEEASHAEQQLALGGMLIRSTGVRRQVEPHHTDASRGAYCVHELIQDERRLFLTGCGGGLVPDGVDTPVGSIRAECLLNLLRW